MRIYINVSHPAFTKDWSVKPDNSLEFQNQYRLKTVNDYPSVPYIETPSSVPLDMAKQYVAREIFVKATILEEHRGLASPRTCGKYQFGTARAELTIAKEANFLKLSMETSSYEKGFEDMAALRELLLAGALAPVLSYEEKQGKQSIEDMLLYFLSIWKPSVWRRLKMCWKLMRA